MKKRNILLFSAIAAASITMAGCGFSAEDPADSQGCIHNSRSRSHRYTGSYSHSSSYSYTGSDRNSRQQALPAQTLQALQQQMEPQQMELLLTDQLLQTVLPLMHLPVLTQALIQALPVQVLLQEMLLPLLEILSLPLWMHTVHRSNMSRHMMQTATK